MVWGWGYPQKSEKERGTTVASKGYQNYRGRRLTRDKLLIALLVLILLGACLFLAAQRFIVYNDDGSMRLELPFLQLDLPMLLPEQEETDPPPEEEPPQTVDLVIEPPAEPAEPEAEPEPEPPAFGERRLVELEALPADAPALAETLSAAGANGFLCRVRDNTGRILFSTPTGQEKAVSAGEAETEQLRVLCAAEGVAAARFNCFHDSYYAFVHMPEAAICQKNGYVWYDQQSYHWLDPSKEQARQYVITLAKECAELGFEELILEECAYPTSGNLHKIDYSKNTMSKSEALALFLTELRAALEPYGTKLSILLTEELILAGSDEESGQDLAALVPLVDAVYAKTGDPAAVRERLAAAAGEGGAPVFVPLVEAPGEGDWCQAAG